MMNQSCSSTLLEHSHKTKHCICIEYSQILANKGQYSNNKFMQAIEMEKYPNNINKDNGCKIFMEAIEMEKHPNNINKDNGCKIFMDGIEMEKHPNNINKDNGCKINVT